MDSQESGNLQERNQHQITIRGQLAKRPSLRNNKQRWRTGKRDLPCQISLRDSQRHEVPGARLVPPPSIGMSETGDKNKRTEYEYRKQPGQEKRLSTTGKREEHLRL